MSIRRITKGDIDSFLGHLGCSVEYPILPSDRDEELTKIARHLKHFYADIIFTEGETWKDIVDEDGITLLEHFIQWTLAIADRVDIYAWSIIVGEEVAGLIAMDRRTDADDVWFVACMILPQFCGSYACVTPMCMAFAEVEHYYPNACTIIAEAFTVNIPSVKAMRKVFGKDGVIRGDETVFTTTNGDGGKVLE